MKLSVQQENITVTNIYTPNDKTSKIYEAKIDKIEEIAWQ